MGINTIGKGLIANIKKREIKKVENGIMHIQESMENTIQKKDDNIILIIEKFF